MVADSEQEIPSYQHVVIADKPFQIELKSYFSHAGEKEEFILSADELPETLNLDPMSGELTGTFGKEFEGQTLEFSINATSLQDASNKSSIKLNLFIVPGAEVETETASSAVSEDFFKVYSKEIHEHIKYIINNHFIYLLVHDGDKPFKSYGKLVKTRTAKSGWRVYEFENCLCINAGELAYAEGNRHLYIETLREFFQTDVAQKAWKSITLVTNTEENLQPAWIIAKEYNLSLTNEPPSLEAAETLMRNLAAEGKEPKLR